MQVPTNTIAVPPPINIDIDTPDRNAAMGASSLGYVFGEIILAGAAVVVNAKLVRPLFRLEALWARSFVGNGCVLADHKS